MGIATFLQLVVRLDHDLEALLVEQGPLAYAVLGAIVFCGIGVLPLFFLPADMLLFVSGALSAVGVLHLKLLVPFLIAAAVAANVFNYAVARAIAAIWKPTGQRWFDAAAARTRKLYARYGAKLLLFSPFLAVVRAGAPAIAGATAMPFGRFVRFASAGGIMWVLALTLPGYFFGNVPWVRQHLPAAMVIVITLPLVVLVARAMWLRRRAAADRAPHNGESRCD